MSKTIPMQSALKMNPKAIQFSNRKNTFTLKINKARFQLWVRRALLLLFVALFSLVVYEAMRTNNPLFATLIKVGTVLALVMTMAWHSNKNNN